MRDASLDKVLQVLESRADEAGLLAVNVDELCDATGYSRATVKRAIQELGEHGAIAIDSKRGRGGGYRIGLRKPEKGSEKGSEMAQKLSPIREHAMPFEKRDQDGLTSIPDPDPFSHDSETEPNSAQYVRGPGWLPAELPADVRKRGAQFFKEVRLSLLPNKPKANDSKGVHRLEPLPKSGDQ